MQDIDFGRYYRKNRKPFHVNQAQKRDHASLQVNKVSIYLALGFCSLAIGFISGTQLQKYKMIREYDLGPKSDVVSIMNVGNPSQNEKVTDNVHITRNEKETQPSAEPANAPASNVEYFILAKIYEDEKEATLNGLHLKRAGMNVRLSRNGKKVKLYVGPLIGKPVAYETLAKIKRMSEFQGAILYRK